MHNHLVAGTLALGKDRFETFRNAIKDFEKIEVIKEDTDEDDKEYVHFYFEITSVVSILSIFHAGIDLGSKTMANALTDTFTNRLK
jgi:hypothetical protein